ncbi:Fur-regulated basic protein FbpA [Alkalihalobacillus sp. BA299]|uniref:Fur-regulated basic protein FbpA n=1 Tax=Alkalihalobacillus sp. BA299 TaxID=2815938 RepID=UPI001ADAEF4D|nr:Fur-regulated basic protein FbpA [Alkalihalobacillus sp. BA299]
MSNQLREAVGKMKKYYIQQLIDSGVFDSSYKELDSLTLTELEILVKKFLKT